MLSYNKINLYHTLICYVIHNPIEAEMRHLFGKASYRNVDAILEQVNIVKIKIQFFALILEIKPK